MLFFGWLVGWFCFVVVFLEFFVISICCIGLFVFWVFVLVFLGYM